LDNGDNPRILVRSTAEELALRALVFEVHRAIKSGTNYCLNRMYSPKKPEMADAMIDILYMVHECASWDADVDFLFEPSSDGVEHISELGIANFSFKDWFKPFDGTSQPGVMSRLFIEEWLGALPR
jgi:hypothetical protein